jgi:hypothetical protein
MGYVQTVTLAGGPKHGEVFTYPEPLPRVFVYQRKTESGWVSDNYHRVGTTLTYSCVATGMMRDGR